MGLFTPGWKSDDPKKRAKALDKMNDKKLCAVVMNKEAGRAVCSEAIERMSEETRMRLIHGEADMFKVRTPAAEHLQQEENLEAVATDARLEARIRLAALDHVRSERILAEIIRSDWACREEKAAAIGKMRSAGRITELACEQDLVYEAVKRLRRLDDDIELRRLMLNAETMDRTDLYYALGESDKTPAFLTQLYNEARSEAVRKKALEILMEKGWEPAGLRQTMRKEIQERIRTGETDDKRMGELFSFADRNEPLTDPERQYLYNVLCSHPFCWYATEFLNDCGDPAGKMFFRFYEALDRELPAKRYLTDEEVALVLQIPEDLALIYLKAFARKGENGNGKLGGARTMLSGCARAVRLMHESGRNREQIEKEFPQSRHYRIEYSYQDSENDIRDDTDEFTIVFWE